MPQHTVRPTRSRRQTEAMRNGAKIRALLEGEVDGLAELYRTIRIGTANHTFLHDQMIGRIRYLEWGPDEFAIYAPEGGERVGTARREFGRGWSITEEEYDGTLRWRGYFDRLTDGVLALGLLPAGTIRAIRA